MKTKQPIALEWTEVKSRAGSREEARHGDCYHAEVSTNWERSGWIATVSVWHHDRSQQHASREVMRERFRPREGEETPTKLEDRCKRIAALVIESDLKLRTKIARLK